MKAPILTYKTFEITFDTDKEEFHAISDKYDSEKGFKSFGAAKKFIEEHIKANNGFKPIFVRDLRGMGFGKIKITGQRKVGGFTYEENGSHKVVISDCDLNNIVLEKPEFGDLLKKKEELEKQNRLINTKIGIILREMKESKTLFDLQKEIGKI